MNWPVALAFGAVGGAIVEVVTLWANLAAWQQHRRRARRNGQLMPRWTMYFDPGPDVLVAATRLSLGAVAGLLFHAQVTGQMAMIAVGASAPALLRQLGAARTGREASSDVAQDVADTATHSADATLRDVSMQWAQLPDPGVAR